MATQSGTLVFVDPGHSIILVAGGSGTMYYYLCTPSAAFTRDGITTTLGNFSPTDSVTVATDAGGNVTNVDATSALPI